ncbi:MULTISPECIES: hypothetical protein [unclassified Arsukibacterium]|mgnify:CR=1 FL=1|uniref:hypothetical protein n=1 Tax=unclassified Arsukibacterium TaxID=2635278 RepID=UPI000C57DBFA|nr:MULTISPECIES: hypothetical protein [unclassified Arsukibacterium]MAA94217.1 hypothetical protein [Rheinheimera sp.]MBM34468.1 hypothetical protein [Rheinheimera sp.]HAW93978.1 hypothetical protein [Candidatus Azambacteria bacterium]|tara:strand:- start:36006 stop:36593 length:588 start_codon:yes stop_codon:yes gene_type:complete
MDNKDIKTTNSRRKFIVRAGMGSLPVLMALKSKGAWGYTTQNCNLSASMSQMQSTQADQFESCVGGFKSHGSGKQYFKTNSGNEQFGYFLSTHSNYHSKGAETFNFGSVSINENTTFSDIFGGGDTTKLKMALQGGGPSLRRNITSLFLHSMFYRHQEMFPDPEVVVSSYNNAILYGRTKELEEILVLYIDGVPD